MQAFPEHPPEVGEPWEQTAEVARVQAGFLAAPQQCGICQLSPRRTRIRPSHSSCQDKMEGTPQMWPEATGLLGGGAGAVQGGAAPTRNADEGVCQDLSLERA